MILFKIINNFAEQKAKRKEKWQVNINPNSLIGREIKYQTALMHEILSELRKQTEILRIAPAQKEKEVE